MMTAPSLAEAYWVIGMGEAEKYGHIRDPEMIENYIASIKELHEHGVVELSYNPVTDHVGYRLTAWALGKMAA